MSTSSGTSTRRAGQAGRFPIGENDKDPLSRDTKFGGGGEALQEKTRLMWSNTVKATGQKIHENVRGHSAGSEKVSVE